MGLFWPKTYLASKAIEFGENAKGQLHRSRPFKVIEVGTNLKQLKPIVQILDTAFLSHPSGLRDNVRCSSWAHWKARSGLPVSDNGTIFARCYG